MTVRYRAYLIIDDEGDLPDFLRPNPTDGNDDTSDKHRGKWQRLDQIEEQSDKVPPDAEDKK